MSLTEVNLLTTDRWSFIRYLPYVAFCSAASAVNRTWAIPGRSGVLPRRIWRLWRVSCQWVRYKAYCRRKPSVTLIFSDNFGICQLFSTLIFVDQVLLTLLWLRPNRL